MSYSQFKTESGIEFYYDNVNNKLLELDGSPVINTPVLDHSDYASHAQHNYDSRQKHNRPAALKILMGHACNYSCTYCMQKDIGNPNELPKRANLDNFFKSIWDNLDLSNLTRVELWGGEPFLYWADMVELMSCLDRPGLDFSITTNGSALSPKHAEFFSKLKANVLISISHDAERQQALRGDEIFDRVRVIETLKLFDTTPNVHYGFICSVTDTNFNLFEINDFFRNQFIQHDLGCNQLSFSLGRTYQEKLEYNPANSLYCNSIESASSKNSGESFTHVIHGENLEKFRYILREFLEQHHQQFVNSYVNGIPTVESKSAAELSLLLCDIYEHNIAYSVIEHSRKLLSGEPILETTNCGADMKDILSLDLDGSVRTCPHAGSDHICGSINNLKGVRILSLDLNRKKDHCAPCPNKLLCRSSCPIKFPNEVFLTNCRAEKIWYGEIQMAAFRFLFNSPVTLVANDIDKI
jgi:radical SAM protein with 4Fe4S-binding SPASM domain